MSTIDQKVKPRYRADDFFYLLGKVALLPVALFGLWFADHGFLDHSQFFECALRRLSGLPCPGCGGTRAFYHLFRGEIAESFRLNPTVLYGAAAYLHFMLLMFYRKRTGRGREKETAIAYYLYGAAGVLLLQWIVKIIRIMFLLSGR